MKFVTLFLVGAIGFLTVAVHAQAENQACDKLKYLAGEAIIVNDYNAAATHLITAEVSCNGLDSNDWQRLLQCLKSVINEEVNDQELRRHYIDTLMEAWDRQEQAGLYDEVDDLQRGMYLMQSAKPDPEKADVYFQRGIKAQGNNTHEAYLVYAYYTTYLLCNKAEGEEKSALKKRMISDYLAYSEIADSVAISQYTQESLDTYFDYIFPSCDELLPSVQDCIETLPADTTDAIQTIKQLITLIENESCSESTEYRNLVDEWLKLDSNSLEANFRKDPSLNQLSPTEKIDYILRKTDDPEIIAHLQYMKAYTQFKLGQYRNAYTSGLACTGEYQSKGTLIAAQCVAATATTCGTTTFERKCNYLYAAELAEQAGHESIADRYRSSAPSNSDCPIENRIPFRLSCWGVTVIVCP